MGQVMKGRRCDDTLVSYGGGIPLPGGARRFTCIQTCRYLRGFFLALVAGRERRHPARRSRDRELHSPYTWGNLMFCAGFIGIAGLAGVCLVAVLGGILTF